MSAHIVDRSLPYSSQSTCVRLSLNLVECLYQSFKRSDSDMNGKIQAQQLLSKILESFVSKLRSLQVGTGGRGGGVFAVCLLKLKMMRVDMKCCQQVSVRPIGAG